MSHEIFIDWITINQFHAGKSLPVLVSGSTVVYDQYGIPRFERARPARFIGSHETSIQITCNGVFVSLSGNAGRFSRPDNLFSYGVRETVQKASHLVMDQGLPEFTPGFTASNGQYTRGATVSRLDITANYATGSESQARAFIRWLADKSVSRMKKGRAGDESVWFVNSRHMIKAYIKHIEMEKHGMSKDDQLYQWCKEQGIVRVEVELKKRMLDTEGLYHLEAITEEKLIEIYHRETEILKRVDRSDEPDIIDSLPARYRMTAAAWLAGEDVRSFLSRATLFRHAKVLREYGLDILEPRSIVKFPTKVNVIELRPVSPPDWYQFNDTYNDQPALRLVSNE